MSHFQTENNKLETTEGKLETDAEAHKKEAELISNEFLFLNTKYEDLIEKNKYLKSEV